MSVQANESVIICGIQINHRNMWVQWIQIARYPR